MTLTRTLAVLCCGIALFIACKKSETKTNNTNNNNNNNNPTPSAKAQLLIDGKWQMSASTATVNYMGKDTSVDYYATEIDDCDKDDFLLFAANGTCTQDENVNKCADDNQVETGTWKLLANDTRLVLADANPDTVDIEIVSTQFTLKRKGLNSSADTIYFTDTYKNIK